MAFVESDGGKHRRMTERTIHVTVTFSVETEGLSVKEALEYALQNWPTEGKQFDSKAVVFETRKEPPAPKPRRGVGSY